VLAYARATADALHRRQRYIDAVLSQRPLPQRRSGAMKRLLPSPWLSLGSAGRLAAAVAQLQPGGCCWVALLAVLMPLLMAAAAAHARCAAALGHARAVILRVGHHVVRSARRWLPACCAPRRARRAAPSSSCRWSCATRTRSPRCR
jgi:hypothetical protein